MQIEDGITEKRIFPSRLRKIFKQTAFPSSVEDDHKPFEKQGDYIQFLKHLGSIIKTMYVL